MVTIDLTGADVGETVQVSLTIVATDRKRADLFLDNVGLRTGKSLWKIGHGRKTKSFEFTISDADDKFLRFYIDGGNNGESITVENISVLVK